MDHQLAFPAATGSWQRVLLQAAQRGLMQATGRLIQITGYYDQNSVQCGSRQLC
jgi:hypothetical protein